MMREIENLKMNLQLYGGGHGMNLLTYDDLLRFELQLESSFQNARARKFELMHQQQQRDDPKGKGKEIFMDEENQQFYHLGQGSSWEHLMWQAERQMMTCQREVEDDFMRRHMKEQFPFNVDEQPTGLLQLLRTPPSPVKTLSQSPGTNKC
ncbi:PREDICTED: MADS-box protein defh21 [Brassica oleracea var. oleracea]|nr:PREDICTED: MADS-box protein defh21 [Brassica oleracea var. oleracea]